MHDMIIIGGGPAGMTAALYGLRNGKSVLILEKQGFGGQITYSPKVENIPGIQQTTGNEFADRFLDQIMNQGADIELEKAVSVQIVDDFFSVHTEDGNDYSGRSVILATGVKHRMLGLPGEQELVGEGISFCAVCDGDFYTDKAVCVAGGGNSALQEAILLSSKCREVTVLQDLPYFTGENRLQETLFSRPNVKKYTSMKITGFRNDGHTLRGITALNTLTGEEQFFPCDGLFEAIGLIPENDAFASLAELNPYGYFDSDESCLTRTPGVFAAGDCRRKQIRQVTTAAADGAVAALAACCWLDGR